MSKRIYTRLSLGVLMSVAIVLPGISVAQQRSSDQPTRYEIDSISRTNETKTSAIRGEDLTYTLNNARDVARELNEQAVAASRDGDADKACTLAHMAVDALIDGGFEAREDIVRQYKQRMRVLCVRAA
jgi:hypothetical protein